MSIDIYVIYVADVYIINSKKGSDSVPGALTVHVCVKQSHIQQPFRRGRK